MALAMPFSFPYVLSSRGCARRAGEPSTRDLQFRNDQTNADPSRRVPSLRSVALARDDNPLTPFRRGSSRAPPKPICKTRIKQKPRSLRDRGFGLAELVCLTSGWHARSARAATLEPVAVAKAGAKSEGAHEAETICGTGRARQPCFWPKKRRSHRQSGSICSG